MGTYLSNERNAWWGAPRLTGCFRMFDIRAGIGSKQAIVAIVLGAACLSRPMLANAQSMTTLWANEVPSGWPSDGALPRLRLGDMVRSPTGPLVFLADEGDHRAALLVEANEAGAGRWIPVPLTGTELHLAAGDGDRLWVGGTVNQRR